ncbi:MAG: hypothetical protein P8X62_01775 [Flavobacteriaceae bacterium]
MKFFYTFLLFCLTSVSIIAQNSTCNCCDEKHAEFDFWIGSWTVTGPNGDVVGTNTLNKIQDKCVLQENWSSAKGKFTGTSYSFYNSEAKQWEQIWVDNQGGSLHLKGNKFDNQMILKTDEQKNKDGQPFYHRVTWTDNIDGTVRQFWETIANETEITIAFDGLYKKD